MTRRDYYTLFNLLDEGFTDSGDAIDAKKLIAYIRMVVGIRKLKLNEDKTKVMSQSNAQRVTGVIVNKKNATAKDLSRQGATRSIL